MIAAYTVHNVTDGCSSDNYTVPTEPPFVLKWPEINLGDTATIGCPCGNLDLSSTGIVATRMCRGSFDGAGAMWATPEFSKCIFSNITRAMCDLAGVSYTFALVITRQIIIETIK